MDGMRRRLALAALLAAAWPVAAAVRPTLRLGLMPVYGARALVSRYEPLRAYLTRLLGQPVRVETAPDFRRYLTSLLAGEFDVAVAAAHFARIAQRDAGWRPLIQFEPGNDTLLLARAGGTPPQLADLAGRELAVIDRLAITVMAALHHIEETAGLVADRDYRVVEYRNHAGVVHSLLAGASAMAVSTGHGLNKLPADLRAGVTVFRSLPEVPGFVVMAAPGFGRARLDRLRAGLRGFLPTAEGREFMALNGYTGLHAADERVMRQADVYLKETRRLMQAPPP